MVNRGTILTTFSVNKSTYPLVVKALVNYDCWEVSGIQQLSPLEDGKITKIKTL